MKILNLDIFVFFVVNLVVIILDLNKLDILKYVFFIWTGIFL